VTMFDWIEGKTEVKHESAYVKHLAKLLGLHFHLDDNFHTHDGAVLSKKQTKSLPDNTWVLFPLRNYTGALNCATLHIKGTADLLITTVLAINNAEPVKEAAVAIEVGNPTEVKAARKKWQGRFVEIAASNISTLNVLTLVTDLRSHWLGLQVKNQTQVAELPWGGHEAIKAIQQHLAEMAQNVSTTPGVVHGVPVAKRRRVMRAASDSKADAHIGPGLTTRALDGTQSHQSRPFPLRVNLQRLDPSGDVANMLEFDDLTHSERIEYICSQAFRVLSVSGMPPEFQLARTSLPPELEQMYI